MCFSLRFQLRLVRIVKSFFLRFRLFWLGILVRTTVGVHRGLRRFITPKGVRMQSQGNTHTRTYDMTFTMAPIAEAYRMVGDDLPLRSEILLR